MKIINIIVIVIALNPIKKILFIMRKNIKLILEY